MKLSLSQRGWSAMPWQELQRAASDADFSGIELYNIHKNRTLTDPEGPFHISRPVTTLRRLREDGLSLVCLDTSIEIDETQKNSVSDAEMADLLKTVSAFRVPYLAVCAHTGDGERIRDRLARWLALAEQNQVVLLIKTVGVFSDTAALRRLLDRFACDGIAALWDVHHPYRDRKEDPDVTVEHLGAYIRHVHLRDSNDAGEYYLVGEGTLPVEDIMRALSSVDYDGFVSLEWKPEWMPDLQDYEVIFPHFVSYMQRFGERERANHLYPNFDGSGWTVWKPDELINLTFPKVLDRMAEEFPDQYAFKYTTLDYTRTYAEFRDDVDRFAGALVSLGVRAGSKVSVWATNVPEWFIAFWAVTKIGAVLVSVNTAYKIHEAEYLFRQSDTHTIIMIESTRDSDFAGIIRQLCPETEGSEPGKPLHCERLPFLRNIITVGFRMPGCLTFEEAMERGTPEMQRTAVSMSASVRPSDVCNMQYTSGTTGFPKGVMLTHYNVVNNGKCIGDRMGLSTADRMMIQVPMFHCFGMVLSMTASMTHGATLCPLPYFSAKASLDCINQERITCFNGVPTMFIAMFNHPDYRKTDFSHMRTGIMAGAGCPPDLMKRAALPDEMNMRGIVSVYGQTETAPGNTMSSWTDPIEVRTETVGYAFPHVECRVVNPETGEPVPDGQNGEFCSRGYNTMKGYYKMAKATERAIDRDGWNHSGDLAMRDADGNYRITGRLKDMIIRGGENLYPKEIEEFIYTHPAVRDVQVVGVPDERYGEEAAACVILKEGESLSEPELRAYISASLARHKVPRYILFIDSFPMNAAGKVLKYKLRETVTQTVREMNSKTK